MAERHLLSAVELDDRGWTLLRETVKRLEESWQTTPDPDFARFVPPASDPLRQRVLVELIKVDQEYRWQTGQPRLVEAYLTQWPELGDQPEIVAELLGAECLTRAILHAVPSPEEIQSRFPLAWERIDLTAIRARAEEEGRPGANSSGVSSATSDTS